MTPTEIISTSVAGAALLVAWLARLDSKKSAQAAQKSADAACRSNELIAEQLRLTSGELNRQKEKEVEDSRPLFVWRGGVTTGDRFEREFQNVGGEIREISVHTASSEISASINSNKYIPRNGTGTFVLVGRRSLPVSFVISCKTKLNQPFEKRFALTNEGIIDN